MNGLRSLIDEKEHALVIQIKSETLQNVQDRSKYVQELQKVLSNVRHGVIDIRNILDEDFQNMTMEVSIKIFVILTETVKWSFRYELYRYGQFMDCGEKRSLLKKPQAFVNVTDTQTD